MVDVDTCWNKSSKRRSGSADVIVLGNEKGGSGKSTVASHVAVGLLKARQRVATIDLDARHQSFTRYINNLRAWAAHAGLGLEMPAHFRVNRVILLEDRRLPIFPGIGHRPAGRHVSNLPKIKPAGTAAFGKAAVPRNARSWG